MISRHVRRAAAWVVAGAALGAPLCRAGGIATDGTVGPKRTLTGPNFSVTPDLGRRAGNNLFHSFNRFEVSAGESVTLSAPPAVRNILARVTGGRASSIDGLLRTRLDNNASVPHPANLFFINPAGVIFGPDAQLDVGGSFVVATANSIKLADGGRFDASDPSKGTLTSAAPAAFGFLKPPATPPKISVNGRTVRDADGMLVSQTTLQVPAGRTLSAVGGDVHVADTTISAPSGRVGIAAVRSAGDVAIDEGGVPKPGALGAFAQLGDISVIRSSGILVDDEAASSETGDRRGGGVGIQGGSFVIDASVISAQTLADGGNVVLDIRGDVTLSGGSQVLAATGAEGRGGDVIVSSGTLTIRGDPTAGTSFIGTATFADGRAGDTRVKASTLSASGGGQIIIQTQGPGHGGDLVVDAGRISLDGGGSDALLTGIINESPGSDDPAQLIGDVGRVRVTAQTLGIANAGVISDATRGQGVGGDIDVNAESITLDGRGFGGPTGITAETQHPVDLQGVPINLGNEGPSGTVRVRATNLTIVSGAGIASNTFTAAPAGKVDVRAANVLLDGRGVTTLTGIDASTSPDGSSGGGGSGGGIDIRAGTLSILSGAALRANTFSSGPAGDIVVRADRVLIDRQGSTLNTGIGAQVEASGTGPGGSIDLAAGNLSVMNNGRVSVTTIGQGRAGTLTVRAGTIDLNNVGRIESDSESNAATATGGDLSVSASGAISLKRGSLITAKSVAADAGNITLSTPDQLYLLRSQVTTEAGRNGGNIQLAGGPTFLVLNSGRVRADARINGGNITVRPDLFLSTLDSSVTATGALGVSGQITLTQPNTEIGSTLARLPESLIDVNLTLQPLCGARFATGTFSSFIVTGRGGLAVEPGGWVPAVDLDLTLRPAMSPSDSRTR